MDQVEDFRKEAHKLVNWMADYLANIEQYPVKPSLEPGEVYQALPDQAPEQGEDFSQIFHDFQKIILPGMTHWQHPSFFSYFPANSSFPSLLGEMLTATMGAQCMIWDTSPAAAELEEKVMDWLKPLCGIPSHWAGVIQDTASTATLCAILTAREKASTYQINQKGFGSQTYRLYCSSETHSSIEKAAKIAGIGQENVVKIAVDHNLALLPEELDKAIIQDQEAGRIPLIVVATVGTTGTTALDPVRPIGEICQKHGIFYHIDAAYAGSAAILPEKRAMLDGIELADAYLFNPHKWLFTNFDCTAYFVKEPQALVRTFEILPEYLKTESQGVKNYRDWGIPLGRRFRALKLWFVLRSYGVEGLKAKLRHHVELAASLAKEIDAHPEFEMMAPLILNLVCFRFHPPNLPNEDHESLNQLNEQLLKEINQSGQAYLSHTKIRENYILRVAIGQTHVSHKHVHALWKLILKTQKKLANF